MALSTWTLTGWSLTKARVRPSATWTRRRIRSPSTSISASAAMRRAGWSRGQSNTAVTWPCVLAMAHEAAVAAPAEGQGEGIEQDGLASARLTREDAQALMEMKLELVDEDDIADRQLDQHGW